MRTPGSVNPQPAARSNARRPAERIACMIESRADCATARAGNLNEVPRHLFVPGVPLDEAYADRAIILKDERGEARSSSSQPAIMAVMLEQLEISLAARRSNLHLSACEPESHSDRSGRLCPWPCDANVGQPFTRPASPQAGCPRATFVGGASVVSDGVERGRLSRRSLDCA